MMGERELTAWAKGKLAKISAIGGMRRCVPYTVSPNDPARLMVGGRALINFGSNDYLGLSHSPRLHAASLAAIEESGAGSAASRVVTGTRPEHVALEADLAAWLGKESALLFGAGYLANIGVMSTLIGRHDLVLADRYVHASILDGIALSGAKLRRFKHNSVDDLRTQVKSAEAQRVFIVTESVFSMDGDVAPLSDILALAAHTGAAVIVDEAHALGVFGADGAGVLSGELRDQIAVITGTLSKACGSYGGFAACSEAIRELLISSARSFLFNTGLPPASAAAAREAIAIIRDSDAERAALLRRSSLLRERLQQEGFDVGCSASQIVPVLLGSSEAVMRASEALLRGGLFVPAIRPPTVAAGTERLRISLTAGHTDEHVERLVRLLCAHRDGAN